MLYLSLVVYLVKVFAIATAFLELTFCPFTSTFGACRLSLIIFKHKKIPLVFQMFEFPKRCAQINFQM